MPQKSAYHHGDLRNALLDAADEVLRSEGLQGFTLRACARKAGVSHTAPKHHFKDVRGLLTAVAERGFDRLAQVLRQEISAVQGDLDAEMFATARAYAQFALENPEHFRVMFRADLLEVDSENPPPAVVRTFTELTNVILRQRGEAQLEGLDMLLGKSPELVNDIILGWSHIHGYAHLRMEGQLQMVPEESHMEHMRIASERLAHLIRGRLA